MEVAKSNWDRAIDGFKIYENENCQIHLRLIFAVGLYMVRIERRKVLSQLLVIGLWWGCCSWFHPTTFCSPQWLISVNKSPSLWQQAACKELNVLLTMTEAELTKKVLCEIWSVSCLDSLHQYCLTFQSLSLYCKAGDWFLKKGPGFKLTPAEVASFHIDSKISCKHLSLN